MTAAISSMRSSARCRVGLARAVTSNVAAGASGSGVPIPPVHRFEGRSGCGSGGPAPSSRAARLALRRALSERGRGRPGALLEFLLAHVPLDVPCDARRKMTGAVVRRTHFQVDGPDGAEGPACESLVGAHAAPAGVAGREARMTIPSRAASAARSPDEKTAVTVTAKASPCGGG